MFRVLEYRMWEVNRLPLIMLLFESLLHYTKARFSTYT